MPGGKRWRRRAWTFCVGCVAICAFPAGHKLPDAPFLGCFSLPQGDPVREPVTVRVIEYGLQGLLYVYVCDRVITTILDPEAAPAVETGGAGSRTLGCRNPPAVIQYPAAVGEAMSCSAAIPRIRRATKKSTGLPGYTTRVRTVMHEAALQAEEDPDRLSFLHTVRVLRRKLPLATAFPPSPTEAVVPKRAGGSAGRTGQLQPRPQRSPGGASTH